MMPSGVKNYNRSESVHQINIGSGALLAINACGLREVKAPESPLLF